MKKAQPATRYEILGYFLGQLGESKITREQFWKEMNARGLTDADIDQWTSEFYVLEEKKDADNARREREKEQSRAARGTTQGYARGQGGGQREDRRQEYQGDEQSIRSQGYSAQDQDARQENSGAIQDEARENGSMSEPVIKLSDAWIAKATDIGAQRHAYALSQGYRNYGTIDDGEERHHVAGAIGECAVAAHFKLPWKPNVGVITGVDVGNLIEVRTRILPGKGFDLAIRPDDKEDKPYVLTFVLKDNSVRLIGWLYGKEGKHGQRGGVWNEGRQVWFVPPPYRSISDLVSMLATA